MSVVAFTVERIKAIAFNALSDETVPDDVLAQNYRGMNLLISRLEAESKSVADLPVVDTPPICAGESGDKAEEGHAALYRLRRKAQKADAGTSAEGKEGRRNTSADRREGERQSVGAGSLFGAQRRKAPVRPLGGHRRGAGYAG